MTYRYIDVTATVRIVSTVKGKPLTETENFNCKVQIMDMPYPQEVLGSVINTEVRFKFLEVFQERLKSNSKLKNSIGGTRWSVDVSSIQYEDPTLLKTV